jgi:hypothetical protein
MSHDHDHRNATDSARAAQPSHADADHDPSIARRTSLSQLRAIQMKIGGQATESVHAAAARGVSSAETSLPFADKIQASFGAAHDVSGIRAHVGGDSAKAMGATAFAAGNHVVFDRSPDLHTAAHEAAHVVQQAKGVNLYGGVGEAGDSYESHADAVADRVVAGESAADLLAGGPSGGASTSAVQKKGITDGTKAEHEQAHDDADSASANAFADQIHLLAVRMRESATEIDNLRMGPHNPDAGPFAAISVINSRYDLIKDEAEEIYQGAMRTRSLSQAQQSQMHTDMAILAGSWGVFKDACDRAMNWGRENGTACDPQPVYQWLDGAMQIYGMSMSSVTPITHHDRIDGKTSEDLENETISESIGAIHACVAAVRKNVTTSAVTELSGDLSKLIQATHEVKELITTTAISSRIRGTTGLKSALSEIHTLETELQSANPGLLKQLDNNSMFTFDLRTLGEFVRSHKPAKKHP